MGHAPSKSPGAPADEGKAGRRRWSDLPDGVVHEIVMRLSSPYAFYAFAGVCMWWRSVAESAKHAFISSQPPLLLNLPPPTYKGTEFSLYSLAEDRSYKARAPFLAKVLLNFRIGGHSHGLLIAVHKRTGAPTLVNLRTRETISLPKPSPLTNTTYGLLTSSIDSGNCMLILHEHYVYNSPVIAYYRLAGTCKGWRKFDVPCIHGRVGGIYSLAVLDDRLYIGMCEGYVVVVDISRDPFTEVRFIQLHPTRGRMGGALRVLDGELVSIAIGIVYGPKRRWCWVQRLELSKTEEGKWVDGMGGGRSVFITYEGCHLWSGRMKGFEDNCIHFYNMLYNDILSKRYLGNGMVELVGSRIRHHPCDRVWVLPYDYEQWGFNGF